MKRAKNVQTLISFFSSFIIVFNKNPWILKMSVSTRFWHGAEAEPQCRRVMQCRCEFRLLQCAGLDSESMFCFYNESNQIMNQYGLSCSTDVRRYLSRFYLYVKIKFQYGKKKKNPFLIHKSFKTVCLWVQNTEIEGRYAFQV